MALDAVRGVQFLLRAGGASIAADGIVGPRTIAAIKASASPAVKQAVSEFKIDTAAKEAKASNRVFVSDAQLTAAIRSAVKRFGPKVEPFLQLMVKLENFPAPGGVFTTYDGTFKGVAQFGADTWRLGAAKLPEVGAYENVRQVDKSMLLAAWYYIDHEAAFARFRRRSGAQGEFSPELGYLYHQQGMSAAEEFLRTGKLRYPRQSNQSVAILHAVRGAVMA